MKWLITITIIAACLPGNAQFYEKFTADLKAALPSKQAIEKVIEKYKVQGSGAKFWSGRNNDRVNFLELECIEYLIVDEDSTSKRNSLNRDELSIYFSNDLVVHINLEKDYKILLTYTDTVLLEKHITRIKNLYGASFEGNKNFSIFSYYHLYDIFGIEWGLRLNTEPEVFEAMENIFKLVYSYKIDALIQLAKSSCNETKAYAAAGLYLLQQEDCDIHKEGKQLLEEIRVSKAPLNFAAGGCVIRGGTETNDALTDYFLKEIRERYLGFKSSQRNLLPVVF